MKHTGALMMDTRKTTARVLVYTAFLVAVCGLTSATEFEMEEAHGYHESGMNLSDYENINLANGNLTFKVPLASVATDGGLSYSMNAFFNSKLMGALDDPWETYYRGVENYGIGWDLRPPRLRADIKCEGDANYPCQSLAETEYVLLYYVNESGANSRLMSVPPTEWGEDFPDDDDHDELCGGTDDDTDCPCATKGEETQICYTWDPPLVRVTYNGDDQTVTVEDESGTIRRFDRVVDNLARMNLDEDHWPLDFREELDGFYLTSIERGPWDGALPLNVISFEYCVDNEINEPEKGEDPTGRDGVCDDDPLMDPWLVTNITASGENPRSISFQYENRTIGDEQMPLLKSLTIPSFSGGTTDVLFDIDATTVVGNDYSFLESITIDPGSASDLVWSFSDPDDFGRPQSLTLPTGATIDYRYSIFPRYHPRSPHTLPPLDIFQAPKAKAAGTVPPVLNGFCDQNPAPGLQTDAVRTRTLRFRDATGLERVESTALAQNVNCTTGDPAGYPYPHHGFFDVVLSNVDAQQQHYLWTWVETYAGDANPETPGAVTTNSTAEIHRYHPRSYQEFSSDALSAVPPSVRGDVDEFYAAGTASKNESFLQTWTAVSPLRHRQIMRSELYESPSEEYYWYFQSQHVDWSKTITNEFSQGSDVRDCMALNPNGSVNCLSVSSYQGFTEYFKLDGVSTSGFSISGTLNVNRYTDYIYDDPDASAWNLGNLVESKVCEGGDCDIPIAWTEVRGYESEFIAAPDGWGSAGYWRPKKEWINPVEVDEGGGETSLTCAREEGDDCIETEYFYDDPYGNLNRISKYGGYGTAYGEAVPDTRYEFEHGRPVRMWLDGGGESLLVWEREIDPGTGLIRWELDGSGAGHAYLYDNYGRVTDAAPIEGDYDDDAYTWIELKLQKYGTDPVFGGPLYIAGTHFEYYYPDPTSSSLAEHVAWGAGYALTTDGVLTHDSTGDVRMRLFFDGMGWPTQLTERYPGKESDYRSKYELRYFHDAVGADPCGTLPGTNLAIQTRVNLSSGWVDGTSWPGCGELDWAATQLDGLGRPRILRQPDGSELSSDYKGDMTTKTTRSVKTVLGDPSDMVTIAITDAFGRLRVLEEQVDAGGFVDSEYGYDARNRLVSVSVGSSAGTQNRSFAYSAAGFLTESTEPERSVSFGSYTALGTLRKETTGGVGAEYVYDPAAARLRTKKVNGVITSSFIYGDEEGDDIGDPAYGKVVIAEQHNRFPGQSPSDVTVAHNWEYGGPGRRLSVRSTAISNLGSEPDEVFDIQYYYDRWGNASDVLYPAFSGCRAGQWGAAVNKFEGAWLTRVSRSGDLGIETLAEFDYHPSGRPADLTYGNGRAVLAESADDWSMARPSEINLFFDGQSVSPGSHGPYAYDGAGNIIAIGGKAFTYDGLNRLTGFYWNSGNLLFQDYDYDSWGNLERIGSLAFSIDGATNQINSSGFDYDDRGNLTELPAIAGQHPKVFEYSADDRLMTSTDNPGSSATVWRYAYDTAGERVARWTEDIAGLEATFYLRDGGGRVLSEWYYRPGGSDFDVSKDYFYGGGRVVAQANYNDLGNSLYFHGHDHLGSTRAVFEIDDTTGSPTLLEQLDFYPFGAFLEGAPMSDFTSHLFTGHERDPGRSASELDYMHARYYSPVVGRFASVDLFGGQTGSSQSWNRYTYVRNNPVNLSDPNGEWPFGVLHEMAIRDNMTRDQVEQYNELSHRVEPVAFAAGVAAVGAGVTSPYWAPALARVGALRAAQVFSLAYGIPIARKIMFGLPNPTLPTFIQSIREVILNATDLARGEMPRAFDGILTEFFTALYNKIAGEVYRLQQKHSVLQSFANYGLISYRYTQSVEQVIDRGNGFLDWLSRNLPPAPPGTVTVYGHWGNQVREIPTDP